MTGDDTGGRLGSNIPVVRNGFTPERVETPGDETGAYHTCCDYMER